MFWKKEKPKFEVRPLYSIREELELIREFCWQPKLAAGKIYTEKEMDAVEKQLNFKLPQPLRELYLVLGDYMCDKKDTWFCRPEELHWSDKYLLVTAMERTNRGWGIYRKDPYLSVYNWQRSGVNSYGEEKAEKPKSEVVRKSVYNQYFSKSCFYWDIFIIHHVLDKVLRDWYGMITKEPVHYSFAEQVEEKTGMLFWSWNGQGRERMEEKEKEMQAAGLFQR